MATAGLVCGIVGTVLSAIYTIFWLTAASAINSAEDEFKDFEKEIEKIFNEQRK